MNPQVSLRRIKESDLHWLFQWRNDERVYYWCRQTSPLHWEDHEDWYCWQRKDPQTEMFAIVNENDSLIGCCGLTSLDKINRRAEFSCYISPAMQGRGYAKAALIKLFKHGFYSFNLNRIWGETFNGNPALSLFYSIGMELEGIRKDFYYRDGNFIDCHLVSISRKSFDELHVSKGDCEETLITPPANTSPTTHPDEHSG